MGKRLNWKRAKSFEGEVKYDDGTQLKNGVVVQKKLDKLASRAKRAEEQWLKSKGMNSIYDRPRGRR